MATTIDFLRVATDAQYAAGLSPEELASVAQSPEWLQMVAEQRELVSSALQTFGANSPKYNNLLRAIGPVVAAIIFIGNVSFPLAVLAGVVPYPVAGH